MKNKKEILHINFIDFWDGFNKKQNYFYRLLSRKYNLIISEKPTLIIYSSFGEKYLNYNCKKVFYTGENIRPDLMACDFAFSFDFLNHKRHFRLPLYSLYVEQDNMLNKFYSKKTKEELRNIWSNKKKFACMVVSNPNSKFRIDVFKKLSKFRKIDSGGKVLNNVGGRVEHKLRFIKSYKFVLAFENSSYNGYTTEKILEPIYVDSIPIYWGNKLIEKDFNPKRFINYNDYDSEEELYKRLVEIEKKPELAVNILNEPVFNKNINFEIEREKVLTILVNLINSKEKPISQTYLHYLHLLKINYKKIKKKLKL